MPIPYNQRRQRRLELLEKLPKELRQWIALRHVETVHKFTPDMQQRLIAAIQTGARVPRAVQYLTKHPEATAKELVQVAGKRNYVRQKKDKGESRKDEQLHVLADLLQICYPDMPRTTAEAMAASELLSEVLDAFSAWMVCFNAEHAKSEFVFVVLCGMTMAAMDHLTKVAQSKKSFTDAVERSGLAWPL